MGWAFVFLPIERWDLYVPTTRSTSGVTSTSGTRSARTWVPELLKAPIADRSSRVLPTFLSSALAHFTVFASKPAIHPAPTFCVDSAAPPTEPGMRLLRYPSGVDRSGVGVGAGVEIGGAT